MNATTTAERTEAEAKAPVQERLPIPTTEGLTIGIGRNLSQFAGRKVVLVSYHRAQTPATFGENRGELVDVLLMRLADPKTFDMSGDHEAQAQQAYTFSVALEAQVQDLEPLPRICEFYQEPSQASDSKNWRVWRVK